MHTGVSAIEYYRSGRRDALLHDKEEKAKFSSVYDCVTHTAKLIAFSFARQLYTCVYENTGALCRSK